MIIELTLNNLRIFEEAFLQPQQGINVITGCNGSGKTTVLEGVYLLSRGRSFRHREAAPLIREGKEELLLTARLEDRSGNRHHLGMRRSRQDAEVRLDGRPASKRSEVLSLLPLQWIGPEPQILLTGSPAVRRSFVDNGLFHVEHRYLALLQKYNRALDQRNAQLRGRDIEQLESWESQMDVTAQSLDQLRRAYTAELSERLGEMLDDWGMQDKLEIQYRRGWRDDIELGALLKQSRPVDIQQRYTGMGPHRADLLIKSSSQKTGRRLSRGQQKMLACALHFIQSAITTERSDRTDILLFDDLPAELDQQNRRKLIDYIGEYFTQSFITSLEAADLPDCQDNRSMFHVEHGRFQQALAACRT